MALTFSSMAKVATQASMAMGMAQSSAMGMGTKSAGALAVTNLMSGDDKKGNMIQTLLQSGNRNRLKGAGLKSDLMSIGQAALAIGTGQGTDISISSSLGGSSGSIISKLI